MTIELSKIEPIDLFEHSSCSKEEFPVKEKPKEKLKFCEKCSVFSECALAEYYKHVAVFWEELGMLNITMMMVERMSQGTPDSVFWTIAWVHFLEAVTGAINRIWYDQRHGTTLKKFSGEVMRRLLKAEYRDSLAVKLKALAHKEKANRLQKKFKRFRNQASSHLNIDYFMKGLPPIKEQIHLGDLRLVVNAANELFAVLGFGDEYALVPTKYNCEDLAVLLDS